MGFHSFSGSNPSKILVFLGFKMVFNLFHSQFPQQFFQDELVSQDQRPAFGGGGCGVSVGSLGVVGDGHLDPFFRLGISKKNTMGLPFSMGKKDWHIYYIHIWLVVSDMTFAIFPNSWDDDPI